MNLPSVLSAAALVLAATANPASAAEAPIAVPMERQADPLTAANGLLKRILGERSTGFTAEIIPAADGHNVFEIESVGGRVVLRGDNGVSIASALNHYLKDVAHCHLSWCGDQLALPSPPPAVPAKVRLVTPHPYRVMFNYCTLSYSCAWWDWPRWERELDFLAMNGINAPLGVIGLEGVWYNTLTKCGFSDAEARGFLVGPAFGAWQWMTNIEGHGGPVSRAWIEHRVALGQRWLARARELGMTPVRQGFSGYVPRLLQQKQPSASIASQPGWCGFQGSCQLDPTDPYFKRIGGAFMEESVRLFGTRDHLWAADPFHESAPPKPGADYLNAVGREIHALMKSRDPQAVWVMQAWSIRKEITDSVPKGQLLVLDLSGKRADFWGHDYIKGQLHNFGGRINLHGDVGAIVANPFAKAIAGDPRCRGMGLFPEAIGQNPVFYDAVFDRIWQSGPADANDWLAGYARRRYGADSAKLREAWRILVAQGPYGHEDSAHQEQSSMIAARPALVAKKSGPNLGFGISYPQLKLIEALDLLLAERQLAGSSDGYRFDAVDLTRQILSNHAQNLHRAIRLAYLRKDRAGFDRLTEEFRQLLADTDTLLATRSEFLLGKWLSDARARGTTPAEADLFARNAMQLVTLWGPAPLSDPTGRNSAIFDYSWREWSGLIARYYLPRWQKFHAMLRGSIDRGDYRDPAAQVHGREAFRANGFYASLADWEISQVNHPPADLPSAPAGDPVATAAGMLEKYRAAIQLAVADENALCLALDRELTRLPDNAVLLAKWKSGEITPSGKILEIDASDGIRTEGDYEIAFTYQSGGQRLDIEWVALLVNGREIARDTHAGSTGHAHTANTYRLATGGWVFNGKYTVRAQARTHGGNDSNGIISIRKR